MLAIHINAGNSKNGNPRRGWIIADDSGSFVDFVDEGYYGKDALRTSPYANVVSTQQTLDVAPGVYRDLLRQSHSSETQRQVAVARHILPRHLR